MPVGAVSTLPQTCHPTVWLWPGQLLYAGPGLDMTPHSGSVWCVAFGIDLPLQVQLAGTKIDARSVLIPPRTTHRLISHGGRIVSCYLDPTSLRAESVRRRFTHWHNELGYHHADEIPLITDSLALFAADGDKQAQRWLDLAAPHPKRTIDSRIAEAARRIYQEPAATTASRDLAAGAGLSESRFLHLFRQEAGTSIRRYRLWIRIIRACTSLAAGQPVTTAAMDAGFASPSHLADRFRSTFGLSATQLQSTRVTLRVLDSSGYVSQGSTSIADDFRGDPSVQ